MSAPQTRRSPAATGLRDRTQKTSAQHRSTDTSAAAQRLRLLAHLRHEAIDTIAARRDLNIMMPAARVKELREGGHNIQTMRVDRYDDQGRKHSRVAVYSLIGGGHGRR